jgi:hypothetical protein
MRGVRGEECDEGGLRGVGAVGALVSPSELISCPSSVAAVSGSTGFPHEVQNLAVGETCAPHDEQYMGGGDSTTGLRLYATSRKKGYEIRSTCTAVP